MYGSSRGGNHNSLPEIDVLDNGSDYVIQETGDSVFHGSAAANLVSKQALQVKR